MSHSFSLISRPFILWLIGCSLLVSTGSVTAAPGDLDLSFGINGEVISDAGMKGGEGYTTAAQKDGKIVVGGYVLQDQDEDFALARYQLDGVLDPSFGTGGKVTTNFDGRKAYVRAVIAQPDGKIVAVGYASDTQLKYNIVLARYHANGCLDEDFGEGGKVISSMADKSIAYGAALQGDGKIVVTGHTYNDEDADLALVRYNPDGTLDSGFGHAGKVLTQVRGTHDFSTTIQIQPDGKILVAGHCYDEKKTNLQDWLLVRYHPDGRLDDTFGLGGRVTTDIAYDQDRCRAVAVLSDGKILATGYANVGTGTQVATVRYHSDGTLDEAFGVRGKVVTTFSGGSSPSDPAYSYGVSLTVGNGGRIVIAGYQRVASASTYSMMLLRYHADGSVDSSFGIDGRVNSSFGTTGYVSVGSSNLVWQDDSKIIAVGSVNGLITDRIGMARFDFSIVPVASTSQASALTRNSAMLNGIFNAYESAGSGSMMPVFEISTDGVDYTNVTATTSMVIGNCDVMGSALATDLLPGTQYFFRVKGINNIGTKTGLVQSFTTLSPNCDLSVLTISAGSLSPAFAPATFSYTATVPYAASNFTVKPVPAQSQATVTVNGVRIPPGNPSELIPLSVGDNSISVAVTAQNVTQTYTIAVSRAAPVQGDLDHSFGFAGIKNTTIHPSLDTKGLAVVVQADGKIVQAGAVWNGEDWDMALMRFHADGSVDASFGAGGKVATPIGTGDDLAYAVAVQPDGKIVLAGSVVKNLNANLVIARYHASGDLDADFGTDGVIFTGLWSRGGNQEGCSKGLVLQKDSRIVVVGHLRNASTASTTCAVARYTSSGNPDSTFGDGGRVVLSRYSGDTLGEAVALQNDGKIVVAGSRLGQVLLARWSSSGDPDTSFNDKMLNFASSISGRALGMAVQRDGKIVVLGEQGNGHLIRYNTDGSLDGNFGVRGQTISHAGRGNDLAIQSDGKMVVGGYGSNLIGLARFNINGTLDPGFGVGGKMVYSGTIGAKSANCQALALQADGKIVSSGYTRGFRLNFQLARFLNVCGALAYALPATEITGSSAVLHGLANANASVGGTATTLTFEYSADGINYISLPSSPISISGNREVALNARVMGLTPGVKYRYRVRAINSQGVVTVSSDLEFTTISNNAKLLSIVPSAGILSPVFSGEKTSYFIELPHNTATIQITPRAVFSASNIKVNGVTVLSGRASASIPLSLGNNLIHVLVIAQDGVTKQAYTVNVTRMTNVAGSPDLGFNGNGKVTADIRSWDDLAKGVKVQADGKVLVAGHSFNGRNNDFVVLRYLPNATLDVSFGYFGKVITDMANADDTAVALAVQADGKIIVAGVTTSNSISHMALARYSANGVLDDTFGSGGKVITDLGGHEELTSIGVQVDGKIVIAGARMVSGSVPYFMVARYLANGSLDSAFGSAGLVVTVLGSSQGRANGLAFQADGKIVVAGTTGTTTGADMVVVRYLTDGSLDSSFGTQGGSVITDFDKAADHGNGVVIQADGKIIVAGDSSAGAKTRMALCRHNANGSLDTTFGIRGKAVVEFNSNLASATSVALQGDGRIVAAGHADMPVSGYDFALAVLIPNGSLDTTFGNSGKVTTDIANKSLDSAVAVAVQGDGNIVAVGHVRNSQNSEVAMVRYIGINPSPEIEVLSPKNASMKRGDALTFGSLVAGTRVQLSLVIKNKGASFLGPLTLSIDGADSTRFWVARQPSETVLPGESTTLTLGYAPISSGAHAATLHIVSNDADESPFDIKLSGKGKLPPAPPAAPVISATTFAATEVLYTTAKINGSVSAGSAKAVFFDYGLTKDCERSIAAVAKVDLRSAILTGLQAHTKYYYRIRAVGINNSGMGVTLNFTTGNNAPLTLDDDWVIVAGSKVALPVLSNDVDVNSDAMSIASFSALEPKSAGTLRRSGTSLVFTPSASFIVASFKYAATDGFGGISDPAIVTLTKGTATVTPLIQTMSSSGGSYDLVVSDTEGLWSAEEDEPWVKISQVAGAGRGWVTVTVLPNASTQVRKGSIFIAGQTHDLTQAGVATAPSLTAIAQADVPLAIVGKDYGLTIDTRGEPAASKVTGLPPGLRMSADGVISGRPTKAGTYPVSITASNAIGPGNRIGFDLVVQPVHAGVIGTFHGFIGREAEVNGNLGSRLEITTTGTAAYSGKIITGATAVAIKGSLIMDPGEPEYARLLLSIPRKGGVAGALDPLILELLLDGPYNSLSGSLEAGGGHSAVVQAWRNTWDKDNKAAGYNLLHTFNLEQPSADETYPQGYGYGAFAVKETTGAVTVSGKLADNSSFTTSSFLGPQGQVLIYQSLYDNKGTFGGVLYVDGQEDAMDPNDNIIASSVEDALTWMKPAPALNSKETVYKNGFSPIKLIAQGTAYVPPPSGALILDLPLPAADWNTKLEFSKGKLPLEFGIDFKVYNPSAFGLTNKALIPAEGNYYKVALPVVNAGMGAFNGSFTIPAVPLANGRKVIFSGQIVRRGDESRGYGFFLLPELPGGGNGSSVVTTPKHSGRVILKAQSDY